MKETVEGIGADLHLEVVGRERRRGLGVSSLSPGPLRMRRVMMMMMRRRRRKKKVRALVKKMSNLKLLKRGRRAALNMERTMHSREIVDTLTRTTVSRFQTPKMTRRETGVETVRRILLLPPPPPPQRRRILLSILLLVPPPPPRTIPRTKVLPKRFLARKVLMMDLTRSATSDGQETRLTADRRLFQMTRRNIWEKLPTI